MNCSECQLTFDASHRLPKIMPCLSLTCLECLHAMPNIQSEYAITCSSCRQTHLITNLNEVPTSQITLFRLANSEGSHLERFAQNLDQYLRDENFEIYKLYDSAIFDIDIRAETLVQLVISRRDQLQKQIRLHLKTTSEFLDGYSTHSEMIPLEMASIRDNLLHLDSATEDMDSLICQANKLQNFLRDLKHNAHFLSQHSSLEFDKSLLGLNLNPSFDANFKKVKHIGHLLSEVPEANKVSLKINFTQSSLRQEVFPLNDRLVKMYFTSNRTIVLESFDLAGNLIKSDESIKDISSFPIHSAHGLYFVVGFTCVQRFCVHLYDSDLNLIQSKKNLHLIESIFLNEKNMLFFYENRANECCQVYDLDMKLLSRFGQNLNKEEAFYMPKSIITNYEHSKFCFKFNSSVFGLTEKRIYLSNYNIIYILDRKSGKELKRLELSGFRPNLMLDTQGNILKVNTLEKRIAIFNADLEFLAESVYSDDFVCVNVNRENRLHFLDAEKNNLVIV